MVVKTQKPTALSNSFTPNPFEADVNIFDAKSKNQDKTQSVISDIRALCKFVKKRVKEKEGYLENNSRKKNHRPFRDSFGNQKLRM